jgi:hypothetical protein
MAPIHSRPLHSSCSCKRLLLAAILLCSSPANAVIIRGENSSWCSSSFEGEPQQQINDRFNGIIVSWYDELSFLYDDGCGQLPRATWTIEPAPEGVNTTQIWMSPPNLGWGFVDKDRLWVAFNRTAIELNNTANDTTTTEIGVLIQVPKDQLRRVDVDSPLRVNIAQGFTNLRSLQVHIDSAQNAGNNPGNNYTCGKYEDPSYYGIYGAGEELNLAGLGAEVRADLSTVEGGISLGAKGAGNDIAVKLPEDASQLTYMWLEGRNARYYIQGNVDCSNVGCSFRGGSADLCKEDCFSQLVIDGEIDGNITVSSDNNRESDVVSVAKVDAPGSCDQFVPENPAIFNCTAGAAASATVEVVPLPCTMQEEDMTLSDVVECPDHHYPVTGFCRCYVPTSETCPESEPEPEESSPASFGAMLSKTVSFGFTGMLCYALSMLVL